MILTPIWRNVNVSYPMYFAKKIGITIWSILFFSILGSITLRNVYAYLGYNFFAFSKFKRSEFRFSVLDYIVKVTVKVNGY